MTHPKPPSANKARPPERTEAAHQPFSEEQAQRIDETRDAIRIIHSRLSAFLRSPGADDLAASAGGDRFLEAEISTVLADKADGFEFPYFDKKLSFTRPLLWTLSQARERLGVAAWEEFIRLFLLHEGYHIAQRLTAYNYRGIGRAGFVLEGIDYDADVFSILGCLAWRHHQEKGRMRDQGEMAALLSILENAIGGLSVFDAFEGRFPLREIPERRLRRNLIWSLQLARAAAAPRGLSVEQFGLRERVIVEAPGVLLRMEERDGTSRSIALLSELDHASEPQIAIYARGRLFRSNEAQALEVLEGIRNNDMQKVKRAFSTMFDSMRELVPWPASSTTRAGGTDPVGRDIGLSNPSPGFRPAAPSSMSVHIQAGGDAGQAQADSIVQAPGSRLDVTGLKKG